VRQEKRIIFQTNKILFGKLYFVHLLYSIGDWISVVIVVTRIGGRGERFYWLE